VDKMSVSPASPVLVLVFLASLATCQQVPGIDAWKTALQQHAQAEFRATPSEEGAVPGLGAWKAHQRAVLEAERRLNTSGEVGPTPPEEVTRDVKGTERVDTQKTAEKEENVDKDFKQAVKESVNRLLAKLSGKHSTDTGDKRNKSVSRLLSKLTEKPSASKGKSKTPIEKLLEQQRKEIKQETSRAESFLDKLLASYTDEEREESLKIAGKSDPTLELLEERRIRKLRNQIKERKAQRILSLLNDYDYDDFQPRRSSVGILSGDNLSSLFGFNDYDYEEEFRYRRPSKTFPTTRFSKAARESLLIEKQLKKLLRNSS